MLFAGLVLVLGLATLLGLALQGGPTRSGDRRAAASASTPGPAPRTIPAVSPPADPGDLGSWLRRIDAMRVEERPLDARAVGRSAYAAVAPEDRPEVLRALTLATLADVPEAQAFRALSGRIDADPGDLDARVALLRRSLRSSAPPPTDRPRVGRRSSPALDPDGLAALEAILAEAPGHLRAREALVDALLDAGRVDPARSALDAWPEDRRDDPGWLRLQARFDLDHDGRPDRAAAAFRSLLAEAPHDWRLHAQYARALERSGDPDGAREQARLVDRLRERLDPERLAHRLADDLARLDDPAALGDLAALCASVGLSELAAAWRLEADRRTGSTPAPGGGR